MAQEPPSQSSLAFVLVKVNRRSRSVLAQRKQAVSKQEVIFRNFIQNQSIGNSNSLNSNKKVVEYQSLQLKNSPLKNQSPISIEYTRMREQRYSSQINEQHQRDLIHAQANLHGQIDQTTTSYITYEEEMYPSPVRSQQNQGLSYRHAEDDDVQFDTTQIQENSKQNNSPLLHQVQSNNGNNYNNHFLEDNLENPVFLQTYMKPYKQKSLSFYKQNLQHKKQISQKSDNAKFLQIWNDEDFQVKFQQTHQNQQQSNNAQSKPETNTKKVQPTYNEVPVFFPKNKSFRRSFSKQQVNHPLQKQFMGEDIFIQSSQQGQHSLAPGMLNKIGMAQNSHTSSKECIIELGPMYIADSKQEAGPTKITTCTNENIKGSYREQQPAEPTIQKIHSIKDKRRSSSVKETNTSLQRRRINTNNSGVNATQSGENSALQKILDIYTQPNTNKSSYKRANQLEKLSSRNIKDNPNNNNNLGGGSNPNLSLTPLRQNKSLSINSKQQTPHQTIHHIAQQKFHVEDIPDAKDLSQNRILMQRQRHFKNLYNKLKMAQAQNSQKNYLQVPGQNQNNNVNNSITMNRNPSLLQNNPNLQNYPNLQNNSFYLQSTSMTAKQTVDDTIDDTQTLPYKYLERNSYFSATKSKLFEATPNEKPRLSNIESFRFNSPLRKQPVKKLQQRTFERGFTLKEFDDQENQNDYNISNYIIEQRHIL